MRDDLCHDREDPQDQIREDEDCHIHKRQRRHDPSSIDQCDEQEATTAPSSPIHASGDNVTGDLEMDRTGQMLLESYHQLSAVLEKVITARGLKDGRGQQGGSDTRDSQHFLQTEERILEKCVTLVSSMMGAEPRLRSFMFGANTMAPMAQHSQSSLQSLSPWPLSITGRPALILPQHIVMNIVQFLPVSSLASCILVNKTFAQACFAKGAIQHALVFDCVQSWRKTHFCQFISDMLHSDPHKLDLIDTVQFMPPLTGEEYELETGEPKELSFSSIFPPLQFVRQGEVQNTSIRVLSWKTCWESFSDERKVKYLQSIYPNLTGIDLDLEICVSSLTRLFPQLRSLSIVSIEDEDILKHGEMRPMSSLQKLKLKECESGLTLRYICHMFPNLVDLTIGTMHSHDTRAELTINSSLELLKDLPVPPLKRLSIGGSERNWNSLYHDFIFRLSQLESIDLYSYDFPPYILDPSVLKTIIQRNQSLTDIRSNVMLSGSTIEMFRSTNTLRSLETPLHPFDIAALSGFKSLRCLNLDVEIGEVPNDMMDIKDSDLLAWRRAIESLVELVRLTAPRTLGDRIHAPAQATPSRSHGACTDPQCQVSIS